jgi:hypothetical protein
MNKPIDLIGLMYVQAGRSRGLHLPCAYRPRYAMNGEGSTNASIITRSTHIVQV